MSDDRYVRVLKHAYFLELLGAAAYRQGARKRRDEVAAKWAAFETTEIEMQRLLQQELQRTVGAWQPPRLIVLLVRGLSGLGPILPFVCIERIIRRVLKQHRFRRWAAEFNPHNPVLWQALVEHEVRQTDYFERGKE